MMDLQEIVTNAVKAERAEEMKTSPQLTLGELILKLEALDNPDCPVVFDVEPYYPTHIGSWRGRYEELSLRYGKNGEPPPFRDFLRLLKGTVGSTCMGYKGGEFLMGKTTPVWVAHYGDMCCWDWHETRYVVDVRPDAKAVILVTAVGERYD